MSHSSTIHQSALLTSFPDPHQDRFSKAFLGFWIYLMTDCLLFTSLFVTYSVLHSSTFGGPSSKDFFDLHIAFAETLFLLCSSVTSGFAILAAMRNRKEETLGWFILTFFLGTIFIALELHEFHTLFLAGTSWTKSAFLSAFFTLVGTHGTHVSIGLLWLGVMIFQLYFLGITGTTFRRVLLFSLFWHFLDLVWIFIFTFVYLMGVI